MVNIAEWSISFIRAVITAVLNWFLWLYNTLGMTEIWIAAVSLAAVFSIILVPLRGGGDLGQGAIGTFALNEVNKKRQASRREESAAKNREFLSRLYKSGRNSRR